MCGIFGIIEEHSHSAKDLSKIINFSQQRGSDSSGLIWYFDDKFYVKKADLKTSVLYKTLTLPKSRFVAGHSRLITNGLKDNQPVIKDNICVLHNGIVVNHHDLWKDLSIEKQYEIDTEILAALFIDGLNKGLTPELISKNILNLVEGVVNCAIVIRDLGKLILFSNSGSLYLGKKASAKIFASEMHTLNKLGCKNIKQIFDPIIIDLPNSELEYDIENFSSRSNDIIPGLLLKSSEESLLEYEFPKLRRCNKCILPETMPYIRFNVDGVCNYCENYKLRNVPKPKEELFDLVQPYRKNNGSECIVPFSGGRDSCFGLHLIVQELKMKPITYTFDWGMVTDLGRRNISRMCSKLGVENVIFAADISKKRDNIKKNLVAWLKYPDLGMVSILTAGDKHFFKYVETIRRQTGISLNLWGINPLEVTHFKAGFLGIPPDFEEKRVYSNGALNQLRYHSLRFQAMLNSPGYFNNSLLDTLSGEYHRSFTKKTDYFHIFDYWKWDEQAIDNTLEEYSWEKAPDTNTTWRIGDGTAAFYNYIYYTLAGFTEHDTFRSNQVREGDLSRSEALRLVNDENRPRYANIKWYLDVVGLDFKDVISTVNNAKRVYLK